ncbi:methyltransferase [Pseudoalteromonas fenneropenaei]|uniref:Methyltransferase n=1 Tax=Pseudoalteromonas fenneropenaei TaxID=1737459 RepID=A0ABV7CJX5_9GAMM
MSYLQQFLMLDELLHATKPYWHRVAFNEPDIPWAVLRAPLLALSDEQLAALEASPCALLEWLKPHITELNTLSRLTILPQRQPSAAALPFWLENGIKGRKLAQLKAFSSALGKVSGRYLEWCAGKGHLGRILAFQGAQQVTALELQQSLCDEGATVATRQQLAMQFHRCDVLQDNVSEYFQATDHAVALHACGRLHQVFLREGVAAGCQKLSLSPCCYHLYTTEPYEALSEPAQSSKLRLTHHDIKLALQETVTAPGRLAAVRYKEISWRLGFDQLRAELSGEPHYVSVPSVGKQIFSGTFSAFCQWAAAQKGLSLPATLDYAHYQQQGERRMKITERIELVRHAFRRALEIWLVLDRVLYLQAAGYDVAMFEFCDKALTPRNILIEGVLTKR